MPGFGSLPLRIAMFAGLFLVAGTSGGVAQDRVGVSSAVNPDASGTPPGGRVRKLVIGQEVVFNERIITGTSGQTQLLFLDESSMSVGPNSDLTIDQFVYDPKSGNGKLAMSATRGLLRYVGGKLSKQEDAVTLRTSTATLAVRGGAFIANIGPNGTDAVFIYGKGLKVTGSAGGRQIVTRPGYHSVTTSGGSPSPPGPVPPGELATFTAQLDGRSGGTGGAETIPTDANVVNSGISQTVSGDVVGSAIIAAGNTTGVTTGTTSTPPNPTFVTDNSSLTPTLQSATVPPGVTPPTPSPPPVAVSYSGFYKTTPGSGSSRGFVSNDPRFNIPYTGGQIGADGFYTAQLNGQTIRFPVAASGGVRVFTAAQDGTQSPFGPINGASFINSDRTFLYSNNTEADFTDEHSFVYGGTPVNPSAYQTTGPGVRPQAGSNTRVFAYQVQPDAALQSNIPFVRREAGGNLPNATVSPLYIVAPPTTPIGDTSTAAGARALQASLAVAGLGANQQSTIAVTAGTIGTQANGQPILNGQMRGSSLQAASGAPVRLNSAVSSMVDGAGSSFYGGAAISGFAVDQTAYSTSSTGTVGAPIPSTASEVPLSGAATSYGFAQPALATGVPSGPPEVGANRTTRALSGNFGGLMYTNRLANPYVVTGGAFVATDAPNNRVQATLSSTPNPAVPFGDAITAPGVTSMTMQYGGLTGAAGAQAFVDDKTFAASESQVNPSQITVSGSTSSNGQLYFVSSGAAGAPTSLLPSGAAYCSECQYLQWGYWGGDLKSTDSSGARIDRGHINTWVAGVPTSPADLNTLAASSNPTGTYTGHAIGSVFNNGSSYVAAGALNANYNFATQSGTFAVTNFDGRSFGGTGRAPLTGANYNFGVTSLPGSPPLAGKVNGTFYGPMAAETGGSFAVGSPSGPVYTASGTFAGKR